FCRLAGMTPVLAFLLLLGGVSSEQVGQALLIMAATALAAGSLGGLVALWREKTFPALALTVLFLVLYLFLVQALGKLPVESWQSWLDPFLALSSVLEPPLHSEAGVAPAYGFAAALVLLSIFLNAWAIVRLRAWNPSGEPIMQRELPEVEEEEKDRAKAP